jgi:hypothetical protein
MTTVRWRRPVSGDFARAKSWFRGVVPGPDDRASISAAGAAFTVASSADETVRELALSANATLAIMGGTFTASLGTQGDADDGLITVAAGASLDLGQVLDGEGAVDIAPGGSLEFLGDTELRGRGEIVDNGTLGIEGGPATIINQNDTISGGGHLSFGGAAGSVFVNGPGGVIDADGGEMAIGGAVLTNNGLIENVGANRLDLYSDVDGEGSIVVGAQALLELQESITVSGQTISVAAGGTFAFSYDGTVDYSGVFDNAGHVDVQSYGPTPALLVQGQATFTGGGTIAVVDAAYFGGAGGTLINADNTIVFSGDFNGGKAAADLGDGQLTIVNQAAGVIEVVPAGNLKNQLIIDCGAGTLTNAGLIEARGKETTIEIASAVVNTGTIRNVGKSIFGGSIDMGGALVNDGVLVVDRGDMSIAGAVTGTGSAKLMSYSQLTLSAAADLNVEFDGQYGGNLFLVQSMAFTGTLRGFSSGDSLVLSDVTYVNPQEATFSCDSAGGVHTATISLKGDYLSSQFTDHVYGSGVEILVSGTPIRGPLAPSTTAGQAHGFLAHAAALSAALGVSVAAGGGMTVDHHPSLARPHASES